MKRFLVPSYSIFTSEVFNNSQQSAMIGLGNVWEGLIGNSTAVWGLDLTPTTPASLSCQLQRGGITQLTVVDSTAPGSGSADSNAVVKAGYLHAPVSIPFSAPTTSGQSINYLVEVQFSEQDGAQQVLNYVDPSTGQGYTGNAAVNTERFQTVAYQVKAGAPAATGTQLTPGADAGWTALWVVTVNYDQTQIVSGDITQAANVPWVSNQLQSQLGLAAYLTVANAANTYVATSQLSTSSTAGSVPVRDASGGLTASAFHGVADSAVQATNAANATTANYAVTAGNATYADSAGQAQNATLAATANVATLAQTANVATLATNANSAATIAGYLPSVTNTPSTAVIRDAGGNIFATELQGLASSALFSDLGERFEASEPLEPGDVVRLGGDREIEKASGDDVFGVISTAPAVKMNAGAGSDADWPYVAWAGRVPVKVMGSCQKGDFLACSDVPGVAVAFNERPAGKIIGRALESRSGDDVGLVLSAVLAVL